MGLNQKQIRFVITGLLLGMLLSALDQTIVSTAMPKVISDLGGLSLYAWVFTIYMLCSTTVVPIFGKLADLFGRKKIFLIGLGLFMLGSALCGLAQNMTELIVFRGIQGIGAGALMPISMTIIGDIFPPERRGKMQGLFGAVFGLSSVIGPAVGGFMVEHLDWHWIFYVNLPFGFVSAVFITLGLKESKSSENISIDWSGAITLTASIIAILLGTVYGGGSANSLTATYDWSSPIVYELFAIGVVLLAAFLVIEKRAKDPIIPLSLFKNRVVSFSSIIGFLVGAGMFGAITYIPLFAQGVIGESPSRSGYILTPLMLGLIVASIIGGRLLSRTTFRTMIVTGLLIVCVGFTLMSMMDMNTSNWTVIRNMIIAGVGLGLLMPTFTIAVQSTVSHEIRGVATSSTQFFRSMGGTIGVSVMGAIMSQSMAKGVEDVTQQFNQIPAEQLTKLVNPQLLLSPNTRSMLHEQGLLDPLREVLATSIHHVFITATIIVVIGLIVGLFFGSARLKKSEQLETTMEAM